jgi:hypothetical protein
VGAGRARCTTRLTPPKRHAFVASTKHGVRPARCAIGDLRDGRRLRAETCVRVGACTRSHAVVVTPSVRQRQLLVVLATWLLRPRWSSPPMWAADGRNSSLAIASVEAAGSVAPRFGCGSARRRRLWCFRRLRVDPPANGVALVAVRCGQRARRRSIRPYACCSG